MAQHPTSQGICLLSKEISTGNSLLVENYVNFKKAHSNLLPQHILLLQAL